MILNNFYRFFIILVSVLSPFGVFDISLRAQSDAVGICNQIQIAVQQDRFVSDEILENIAGSETSDAIGCALSGMRQKFGAVSNLAQDVQSDGTIEYNAYARAVRTMFDLHGYDAIGSFRAQASLADIHSIARTVRHPIRNVRVNSGVILANVIDNSNACVIIDQLYAPVQPSDIDTPAINGRANLIYVSRSIAKWAKRENWEALGAAVGHIERDLSGQTASQLANLNQTRDGIADLKRRLDDNASENPQRAPQFSNTGKTFFAQLMQIKNKQECATFRGYEFTSRWSPSEFFSQ